MERNPMSLIYLMNDERDVFIDSIVSELIQKALSYSSDFMDLKTFAKTHDPDGILDPILNDLDALGYLLRAWRKGYTTKHSRTKILIDIGSQTVLLKKNPDPNHDLGFRVSFLNADTAGAQEDDDSVYFTKEEIEQINPKLLTFVTTDLDEMVEMTPPEETLKRNRKDV